MLHNEIPERPSVDQMAEFVITNAPRRFATPPAGSRLERYERSALARAGMPDRRLGLSDRRAPPITEAPRHLLDTGIEYHQTIQSSPRLLAWTIFMGLASAIGLSLWVLL